MLDDCGNGGGSEPVVLKESSGVSSRASVDCPEVFFVMLV